ncbi:nuclear receptor-interacting protein 3-like isoform X2 [Chiloscyllium plagiosum]|uniref:nuclear receptor-interacting protein 3-like isoform X2 n=1 Tax=Chiloscyllium plagiosum TaxID=36176 RepID=UPI001CB7C1FF|nr:nuclear receptor-interacting protein 3-like isoform X2 [Chiloscyllium plagiosum]
MFYSDILKENRRQQMDIREAASLRQQRRMKQAVQFIHKDSADLLPLDGLKKLGTSKETCAGKEMKVQIDTGSRYNLISSACVDKLGLQELMKTEKDDTEKYGMPLISKITGQIENVGITLGQLNVECSAAVVDDDDKNTLSLGLQTLRSLKCIIDMEKQYLILGEKEKEEIPFLGIDNIEDCSP